MAGEKVLDGKHYIVEIDTDTPVTEVMGLSYRPVLCEVSSSFGISTEEIGISNGCSLGWANSLPGQSSWDMSGEWQAINPLTGEPDAVTMTEVAQLAAGKRRFWIRRRLADGRAGAEIHREGVVWIRNYQDTASAEDPFTFTAEFTGIREPVIRGGFVGILHDAHDVPITVDDNYIVVNKS